MEAHSGGSGHPWAYYNPHCGLFEFIVDVLLMGTLCLFGFAGNTLSFIVLWQEKTLTSTTFLLQAVIIADMAVVWMLFIGDVMPGLAYVIPLLRDCHTVCGYVAAVTKPLLFLGQMCAIWFTLLAVINRYFAMCRPSHAPLVCTVTFAKKQILITVLVAIILTVPRTFDSSLLVAVNDENDSLQMLSEQPMYRLLYLHVVLLCIVYVVPLIALLYLCLRLSLVLQSVKRLRRALATHKAENLDMTQVLLTLAVTILICYCPLLALRSVEWSDGKSVKVCGHLQYYLDSFSKMFVCLNSSLKLVILCLFAKRFCRCLKDTFCSVGAKSDFNIFGMYRCADASEMTLISQMDRHEGGAEAAADGLGEVIISEGAEGGAEHMEHLEQLDPLEQLESLEPLQPLESLDSIEPI